MTEKRAPMNADLLRQRRNLLVTSLTLIAVNLAGATLKTDVSVLGTAVEFANPERIVWGAWVLWAYFLIRYWQYLNEEPNLGIHERMDAWIQRHLSVDDPNGFSECNYWVSWRYCIFWSLLIQHKDWDPERWEPAKRDPESEIFKASLTLRSFISVATKTPQFTDYIAPFLVALLPVLLVIWRLFKDWTNTIT